MKHSYNLRSSNKRIRQDDNENNRESKRICNNRNNFSDSYLSKKWKNLLSSSIITTKSNDNEQVVSASNVKNYLLNDPVLDYYNLYSNTSKTNQNQKSKTNYGSIQNKSSNILCDKGYKFEDYIFETLSKENKTRTVLKPNEKILPKHIELTKKYIKEGIPLIFQAPLCSKNNTLRGVSDIIIRSDYLNKIFKIEQIKENDEKIKAPYTNGKYHYRIIDIKWTTIQFCADFKKLRNSNRTPCYKGQLAIYNSILGEIQGYTPSTAYILGKSYKLNKTGNIVYGYDCFERLGHIDFSDKSYDYNYLTKTKKAIDWYRDLKINGESYSLNPPSKKELYPNMCNIINDKHYETKLNHAKMINELTLVWNIGIKEREMAHKRGVYNWKDKKCTTNVLGINTKSKKREIIDLILKVNRGETNSIIEPRKLKCSKLKNNGIEFFIDIETYDKMIQNKNIEVSLPSNRVLFLAGVGYEEDNKWKYKKFLLKENENEIDLISKMINFIDQKTDEYISMNRIKNNETVKIYHWGYYEFSYFYNLRNNRKVNQLICNYDFVNLNKLVKDNHIVVKGCMNYGLKDFSQALYDLKCIKTIWNTDCTNGINAMLEAIKYYDFYLTYNKLIDNAKIKLENEKNRIDSVMEDIINYNEIDCKVLYEIVTFFRFYYNL